MRFRSAPPPFRRFARAVVKAVDWEKATVGIELRFVEGPGFTQFGPAMIGGIVYMMRPYWWNDMGAHMLARTLLHEIKHVLDYRSGTFFDMTRDEIETRAQKVETLISEEQALALAQASGLEIEYA